MTVFLLLLALSSPAGAGSGQPFLTTTSDGAVLMSWTEPSGSAHAVKYATYRDGKWSPARTLVERDDLIVNWADFPSIVAGSGRTFFAHWLQKRPGGKYAYDIYTSTSRDGGATWSSPRLLNRDGTPNEHGFVSIVAQRDGTAGILWLDGREMHGHGGEMTVRYGVLNADGSVTGERVLDARACECCGTAMTRTSDGLVAAYRDRSAEEIRDIAVVRQRKGGWTEPKVANADGWKINGCPVNGPQLAANGKNVALAWFTAAQDRARVSVAFSNDSGASFGKPVSIDVGSPIGRVDTLTLDDGSALVSWIDGKGENASILLRRVWPNGRMNQPVRVASSSTARGAGFPRMTLAGDRLYIAWTEITPEKQIRFHSLAAGSEF